MGKTAAASAYRPTIADKQKEIRSEICSQLAEDMETLGPEWVKEWACMAGAPVNPFTGTEYQGGNAAALMCAARQKGYADNRWCTFNNARSMGWHVRKGEKSTTVEFWKKVSYDDGLDPENEDRKEHIKSYMKLYSVSKVFNFEQIEGAPQLELPSPPDDLGLFEIADALVSSSRCPVEERVGDMAFYAPAADRIVVPERRQFSRPEAFVSTLLHEMGHSTGPEFGRVQVGFPVDPLSYSKEEVIAELSAVFSSASLGIGYDRDEGVDKASPEYSNHVAYLKHYAGILREDSDILFKCAASAQKATDAIISRYDAIAAERGLSRPKPERFAPEKTRVQDSTDIPKRTSPSKTSPFDLAEKMSRAYEEERDRAKAAFSHGER